MNRRDCLKMAAASSLAVISAALIRKLPFPIPGDFSAGDFVSGPAGRLFKGTSGGRILYSANGGTTWRNAANFGEEFQVKTLQPAGGGLAARLVFRGESFDLISANGTVWRTIG